MTEPKQFGDKYLLLDTLGTGGMAEIFRGKLIGDKGFEKLIVIKKLLDHLTKDQEMVSHFIDEARLAALLQHDNIACIYDFGSIEGTYFIAMEYLFGKDLHSFLKKVKKETGGMYPEHALYIASKICDAMSYAHNLKDLQNNELHIIHRDLTPHNIFITYEGKVKVIDFGIAKNDMQENKTQVGVVKGKISYMSPEQLAGAPLDHRSDIFSIGILLYEMLSGKKLYSGDTAEIIPKAINADYTPLQELIPDLPSQIYAIVEKALQKDLTKRYQSCSQMQTDVEECLFSYKQRLTPKVMKNFALELFEKEYEEENENATRIISKTAFYSSKTNKYDSILEVEKINAEKVEETDKPSNGKKLPNNILYIPAAATVILILFFLGWQLLSGGSSSDVSVDNLKVTATKPKAVEVKPISKSKTQERIDTLLHQAAEAERKKNLIGQQDSAYEIYSEIFYIVDKNEQAEKGKERVVEKLYNQILADIKNGETGKARKAIAKWSPNPLTEHQAKQLISQIDQTKENKVQELWQKGEAAFNDNRLTTPADDCALMYYKEMERLSPNDSKVKDGYNKIANRYLAMAERQYRKGKVPTARLYVENGLSAVPDHNRLLELKKELSMPAAVSGTTGVIKGVAEGAANVLDNIFD